MDTLFNHRDDPANYLGLVYGKGAQASMILDRHLLEHSSRRHSVLHLIRLLIRRHGEAFDRAGLVAAVSELSGVDSRSFLESLLDRPGPLGRDSLESTYAALKAMGRLESSQGAGKAAVGIGERRPIPDAEAVGDAARDRAPGFGSGHWNSEGRKY
jgi:predicted metalloprotease with PDZ domain